MNSGTNIEYARLYNRRVVMETIRLYSPLSRADLARATNLTNQTISNLVDLLIEEGVVQEVGRRVPTRGQPARDLAIRPEGAYSIGLHLERDYYSLILTDLSGKVVREFQEELGEKNTPANFLPRFHESWRALEESGVPWSKVWGVGIAGPGPTDADATMLNPANFWGWDGVNLKKIVEEVTDKPVYVENDARAAAVGELRYGWGKSYRDFMYVYYSLGIGLGIIRNRELLVGSHGKAGEIGHTVIVPEGQPCPCGRRGCLETQASLTAIYSKLRTRGYSPMDPHSFDRLWEKETELMHALIDEQAKILGTVLEVTALALDVEAIVLGGRLAPISRSALAKSLQLRVPSIPVRPSELSQAAAMGAAAYPFYKGSLVSTQVLFK